MENKTIAQLEEEISALEEKKCEITAALKEEFEKLRNEWSVIINEVIDAPMALTYINIAEDFDSKDYLPRMAATVEYVEEDEGVFGSDFSLDFSLLRGISINAGTMGTYSKEDVSQVARAKAIAKIWENVDSLEAQLKATDVTAIVKMKKERYALSDEISDLKREIISLKKQELNDSMFVEGTTLTLKEKERDNLFRTNFSRWDSKMEFVAKLTNVARKKVTFEIEYINSNGKHYETIVTHYKDDVTRVLSTSVDKVWDLKIA